MFLRAYRICSDAHIDNEIKNIYEMFTKIGYPRFFIDQALSAAKTKFFAPTQPINEENSRKNLLIVPYNASLDHHVPILKKAGIDLVFTYPNTTRKALIHNNYNLVEKSSPPCIYTIPCGVCPKVYIGETGRTLEKRIGEHKNDVRLARDSNACFVHMRNEGHNINWKEAKVVHKSSNGYERKMLEALMIQKISNFNLSGGQWGLEDPTSTLVSRAFPKLLEPPWT